MSLCPFYGWGRADLDPRADRGSEAGLSSLNIAPMFHLHKAGQGPDPDVFWGCERGASSAVPLAHTVPGRRNMEVRTGYVIVVPPRDRSPRLTEQM